MESNNKVKRIICSFLAILLVISAVPSMAHATEDATGEICAVGRQRDQRIELKLFSQDDEISVTLIVAAYLSSGKMVDCVSKPVNVTSCGTDVYFEKPASGERYKAFVVDGKCRPHGLSVDVQGEDTCFVTFSDYDGRILSIQTVPCGENAVSPPSPHRVGYTFVGWDKNCSEIITDTILTARYTEGSLETHSVTFYDDDGVTILKKENDVRYGGYAVPPTAPVKAGLSFLGWSGQYANVTEDTTAQAVYSNAKNVFCLSSSTGSVGSTATVLLSLKGQAKVFAFDLNIMYDEDLELIAYDDDLDMDIVVNANAYSNGIKLNYSGTRDVTKERDVIELTFRIKNGAKAGLPVWISMNSIYEIVEDNAAASDYHTIDSIIMIQ